MDNTSENGRCLYFAYGSNLYEPHMKHRVAFIHSKQKAVLSNYTFAFNKPSKDGTGKANIIAKNGSNVYGIVYELDIQSLNNLKIFEVGYNCEEFNIKLLESGAIVKCKAFIYQNSNKNIKPFGLYLGKIITALRINDFPIEYYNEVRNSAVLLLGAFSPFEYYPDRSIFSCIKTNDFETLSLHYFSKANDKIRNGRVKEGYESLRLGFDNCTCDSVLGQIIEYYNVSLQSIIDNLKSSNLKDINFIKAVYYFFYKQYDDSLVAIKSFLDSNDDSETGHYFLARILVKLGKMNEAVVSFEKALSIKTTAKVYYHLGILKETEANLCGLEMLYISIMHNQSSLCAVNSLQNIAFKRHIKLHTDTKIHNHIINHFNSSPPDEFSNQMKWYRENGYENLNRYWKWSKYKPLIGFISALKANKQLFGISQELQGVPYELEEGFTVTNVSYGDSYSNEDTLYEAFEGDESNYWNID